jgi:hypothetical protein
MAGFAVDPAALDRIATVLRTSATTLDAAGSAPPMPLAGECSEAVAAAMALLADTTLTLLAGLAAAGDEVAGSRDTYVRTDENAIVVGQ